MSRTAEVLHEVYQERERQAIRWGGAVHDDHHTDAEWHAFLSDRLGREPLSGKDRRRLLVEVAALAVAAIEAFDRRSKPRERTGSAGGGA